MPTDDNRAAPSPDLRTRTADRFVTLLKEDAALPDEYADALARVMASGSVTRDAVLAALRRGAGEAPGKADDGAPH